MADEEQDGALPDLELKFGAGEAAAVEGPPPNYGAQRQDIDEQYKHEFSDLCRKIALRDMFARIEEVRRAGIGRFYWRGMMDVVWNEDDALKTGPNAGRAWERLDDDDELHYPFNIYQAFGREHISIVASPWKIRMEATKTDSPDALRISSAADTMREAIEAHNNLAELRKDAARLAWTDGRVSFYSRWVTDGARFGYEEENHPEEIPEGIGQGGTPPEKQPRQAKGGVVITAYGVCECKVPINMRQQVDFPYRQLSFEIDLSSAKSMFPWIAKELDGGQPGPGEYMFDRITRIATTQGIRMLTQTGDTIAALPTWQQTWIRPSFFTEIDDDTVRGWFEDNYPDGAKVDFIGDKYCCSRNESMDDHWRDVHPLPGDGQATPSCGQIVVPVQDAVCDMTDLRMETYMKSIPAIWCNLTAANLQAISTQKASPGAHYASEMADGLTGMDKMFWPEPAPTLPPDAVKFSEDLFGNIPQFLTGLYPAAVGEADPANDTLGGIKLLSQASKGQSGIAWSAFREGYADSMMQSVRTEAYFLAGDAENGTVKIQPAPGKEVEIDLEDLRDGNWACKPDGDEAYPNTHGERQQAYQTFVALAGKTPEGLKMIFNPKNMAIGKDILGLQDLEIEAADSEEKQLSEIKVLLSEPPIPNQETRQNYQMLTVAAQLKGQPSPPQPPIEAMWQSSVPIDVEMDDSQAEFTAGKDWINSAKGQQAKRDNPDGFLNVRLHLLLHKDQNDADQKAAQQAAIMPQIMLEKAKQQPQQQRTPAESINFADLGPAGKIQVGAQAGLDLRADAAGDMAGETMGENEPPAAAAVPKKPNGKPPSLQGAAKIN